jgi:hypothetical protein
MPTSEKQLAANHQNGLKSTGPKTPEGKASSSANALTHGIRSLRLVTTAGDNDDESGAIFLDLFKDIVADLKPVGHVEGSLCFELAVGEWRMRRAYRAEAGELGLNAVAARLQREADARTERVLKSHARLLEHASETNRIRLEVDGDRVANLDAARAALFENSEGLALLLADIAAARQELVGRASLTSSNLTRLEVLFGLRSSPILDLLRNPEASVENQIHLLDAASADLETRKAEAERAARRSETALIDSLALPASDRFDRIQRYETTIHNRYHRALDQLERLQWKRQRHLSLP